MIFTRNNITRNTMTRLTEIGQKTVVLPNHFGRVVQVTSQQKSVEKLCQFGQCRLKKIKILDLRKSLIYHIKSNCHIDESQPATSMSNCYLTTSDARGFKPKTSWMIEKSPNHFP